LIQNNYCIFADEIQTSILCVGCKPFFAIYTLNNNEEIHP